jgi:tetratricopeptide (TPR) repeat protein
MPSSQKENWYIALYKEERFTEVIQHIEAQKSADFFELNILGSCFLAKFEYEKALAIFKTALKLSGDPKLALCNIGNCYYKLQDYVASRYYYQKALTYDSEFIDAVYNLSLCCVAAHSFGEARKYIEHCMALEPKNLRFLPLATEILVKLDDLSGAKELIQRYTNNNSAQSYDIALSSILIDRASGDFLNAISKIRSVLKHKDNVNADVCNIYSLTLLDLGHAKQAIKALEKLDGGDGRNLNLGVAYVEIGKFLEAKKVFHNCAKLKQVKYEAVWNLGRLDPLGVEKYLEAQASEVERGLCTSEQLIHYHFTSALNLEAKEKFEKAFASYKKANDLQRQKGARMEADNKTFEILQRKFFELKKLDAPQFDFDKGLMPIFIIGMPRSGTSVLENMLSTCSKLIPLGERNFVNLAVRNTGFLDGEVTDEKVCQIREYLVAAYSHYNVRGRVFIDKMPLNFMWLPVIKLALPEAKFLHIKRDKMSTIWSIYSQFFQSKALKFANDLRQIENFYGLYSHYMELVTTEQNVVLNVNYEELVENTAKISADIQKFLNLTDEFNLDEIGSSARAFSTASNVQLRSGMYSHIERKWKNYEKYILQDIGSC